MLILTRGPCVHLLTAPLCVEVLAMASVIHCLESWWLKGQCALVAFTVPLSLHNASETQHWSTTLNL